MTKDFNKLLVIGNDGHDKKVNIDGNLLVLRDVTYKQDDDGNENWLHSVELHAWAKIEGLDYKKEGSEGFKTEDLDEGGNYNVIKFTEDGVFLDGIELRYIHELQVDSKVGDNGSYSLVKIWLLVMDFDKGEDDEESLVKEPKVVVVPLFSGSYDELNGVIYREEDVEDYLVGKSKVELDFKRVSLEKELNLVKWLLSTT